MQFISNLSPFWGFAILRVFFLLNQLYWNLVVIFSVHHWLKLSYQNAKNCICFSLSFYPFHLLSTHRNLCCSVTYTCINRVILILTRSITVCWDTDNSCRGWDFYCSAPWGYTLQITFHADIHYICHRVFTDAFREKNQTTYMQKAQRYIWVKSYTYLKVVSGLTHTYIFFNRTLVCVCVCVCVCMCFCMCVCFSAVLSRLSALQSVKRLFFRWSQSWRDSNNWVYKPLILLCWTWFLSLSLLLCPSHLPTRSHSLNILTC